VVYNSEERELISVVGTRCSSSAKVTRSRFDLLFIPLVNNAKRRVISTPLSSPPSTLGDNKVTGSGREGVDSVEEEEGEMSC
jgi:hypothetical protein